MRVGNKIMMGLDPENLFDKTHDYTCKTIGKLVTGEADPRGWSGDNESYPFGKKCGELECKDVCKIGSTCDGGAIVKSLESIKNKVSKADQKNIVTCISTVKKNESLL